MANLHRERPLTVATLQRLCVEILSRECETAHVHIAFNPDGMTELYDRAAAIQWLEDGNAPGGGTLVIYSRLCDAAVAPPT